MPYLEEALAATVLVAVALIALVALRPSLTAGVLLYLFSIATYPAGPPRS